MNIEVTFDQAEMGFRTEFDSVIQTCDGGTGVVFVPYVSEDGILSWTNNGQLPNPKPVDIKGKNGIDGKPGSDGISATHTWDGTVLTIISASGTSSADLKGEKGEPGIQGIPGEKGEMGSQGEKGDPGNDGQPGADGYTPVKGTDYWTEADKAEMVADVISALPIYNGEVV